MKRLAFVVLAVVIGVGLAGPATAQSVEEVLEKHFEAMGGVERWTGLQTMEAHGTISIASGMMEGPFRIVQTRPAMFRMELNLPGVDVTQAYDGTTAWQLIPQMGITTPEEADAATAAQIVDNSDMDGPLIGWKEAGTEVELLGNEMIDGKEAIKLGVTLKNGNASEYFLDAMTFLPIRIVAKTGGVATTTTLDDYREVSGLFFPFAIDIDTPQGLQALTFDEVLINGSVDASIFSIDGGL